MVISVERLSKEADATGFRPDVQEKVILLIELLNAFAGDEFLGPRIALKGGTALNLFQFNLPRLSVDLDLNYVGPSDVEAMKAERTKVEGLIVELCRQHGFKIKREPGQHAGGRYKLGYESALGSTQNLQVDINFMYRLPLFPLVRRNSFAVGSYAAVNIPIMFYDELVAGKLRAFFSRTVSRDLFDVDQLFNGGLDVSKINTRLAFVLYGAMNPKDLRHIKIDDIKVSVQELKEKLLPVLRVKTVKELGSLEEFGKQIVTRCKDRLDILLPLTDKECEFIRIVREEGKIEPVLLTADRNLQAIILEHPALKWRVFQEQNRQ